MGGQNFLSKFLYLQQKDVLYVNSMESKSLKYINDVSIDTFTSMAVDFENRLENQVI